MNLKKKVFFIHLLRMISPTTSVSIVLELRITLYIRVERCFELNIAIFVYDTCQLCCTKSG
jgi:hypothetical protein